MQHIINHFKKVDPTLYEAIRGFKFPQSTRGMNCFADLCEIIIQQQLSEKAGDTIFKRFQQLFPNGKITPANALKIPDEKLKNAGSSKSKVQYIKNLAQHMIEKTIQLDQLDQFENDQVVYELTKIKGIGRWSAEMFLMFSLAREDVFSYGDLGLRKAIQKLYKLKKEPTQKQAEKIASKWKPYRTYACRILWHSLNT